MKKSPKRTLDKTGRKVADELLRCWPEWEKYVRIIPKKGTLTKGCLVLKIPCDNPSVYAGLGIRTWGTAIYLQIDHDLLHINDYQDVESDLIAFLKCLVEGILSDQILFVSWWQKRRLKISILLSPEDAIEKDQSLVGPANCRVRSWSGKHDKELLYS